MATEEPSVIAAVSGAAKTIQMAGGFKATSSGNIMLSQIQILDVEDPIAAARLILDNKIELIAYGNTFWSVANYFLFFAFLDGFGSDQNLFFFGIL
jgi:hydroxymethylglutaryl-CoA reductase